MIHALRRWWRYRPRRRDPDWVGPDDRAVARHLYDLQERR